MPDPIDILLDPISLATFALYAGLILWEAVAPARRLPKVSGATLRGSAAFGLYLYLASALPLLWDDWFAAHRLFDLTGLGLLGGAAAGLLAYEAGVYAWHRAMHGSNVLWRGFHQMHHSTERLDTFSAFYFGPLDMAGWIALGSLVLTLGVGVVPQAVTIIVLGTTFLSIFTHANVKTPRWLGYLVQRPESHSLHHGRGVHAFNYSDLPLFDMIFGTFRNPAEFVRETGFYDGASRRVGEMLVFGDVTIEREMPAASSVDALRDAA